MQVVGNVILLIETLIPYVYNLQATSSQNPWRDWNTQLLSLLLSPSHTIPEEYNIKKGEEKEGKKGELHTQLAFCYAVQ